MSQKNSMPIASSIIGPKPDVLGNEPELIELGVKLFHVLGKGLIILGQLMTGEKDTKKGVKKKVKK
jgi:hypothetical protein